MTAADNRRLIEAAFAGLARGDNRAFGALMGEGFRWIVPGTTAWSGVFEGREACVRDLFRPLYAQFTETQIQDVISITAEGDLVIVESKSRPMTLANGRTYSNEYCFICRFDGDRLASVREYLDTAAMDAALDPPPWAADGRAGRLPDAAAEA